MFLALLAFSAPLTFLALNSSGSHAGSGGKIRDLDFVPGEVLIKLRPDAPETALGQLRQDADADDVELSEVGPSKIRRLRSRSKSTEALINQLRSNPHVVYAEPNYILYADTVPDDSRFSELYGLLNIGQSIRGVPGTPGADIKAEQAWSLNTGTDTVVVGVVDTGIDYNHPDLAANVWSNPGGIGGCAAGTHGY
ncbi:MAG: hypothetical protein LC672_01745, partial [Acidobacteria bacterium]|nr:hypothetical protein [Acidobacteriota bacterium]